MKKNLVLICVSGLLLALSFPLAVFSGNLFENLPNGILIFFAFVPLFFAIFKDDGNPPFLKGFLCGFVFYFVTLFWITVAMAQFGNISIAGSLGIVIVLAIYLSLYMGTYATLLKLLEKKVPLILSAPLLLVSLELLRNYFLTGFPWANPGYALVKFEPLIQICDLTGVYGLVFLVAFVNTLIYEMIKYFYGQRSFPLLPLSLAVTLLLATTVYGIARIKTLEKNSAEPGQKIAIIQGNIPQDQKWEPAFGRKIIDKYINLSRSVEKSFDLIIWPEASLPYSLRVGSGSINIFPHNTFKSRFLIGATSYSSKQGERISHNSAFYVAPNGSILGYYHKIHLVPFSEHVLYEKYIPFMRKIVPPVAGDFAPGTKTTLFQLNRHKFGVLICFEAIFPELAREFVRRGADFLVNITNDAWFGKTSGPYQHLEISRFRAIENRIFILRAANTGVSAIIDPLGRASNKTQLFKDAVITREIRARDIFSLYTKIGDIFAYLCVLSTIYLVGHAIISKRRSAGLDI